MKDDEAQTLLGRLLDVICLPGHALSRREWERACLLGGRYSEQYLLHERCEPREHEFRELERTVRKQREECERGAFELERWKTAVRTQAERCETCEGDGFMVATLGFVGEDEVHETEVCAECAGTGKGLVASLMREDRERAFALIAAAADWCESRRARANTDAAELALVDCYAKAEAFAEARDHLRGLLPKLPNGGGGE